jgi:methionyl aminopeptidase
MSIKSEKDIIGLKRVGRIVALAIEEMKKHVVPGITTAALDKIGEEVILDNGGRPAPRLVYQFPGATCISVNENIAHGIPGNQIIENGDLVNIDVSVELNGFFADSGYTLQAGDQDPEITRLCDCGKKALEEALNMAKAGVRLNQIGRIIEKTAKNEGYTTIKDLCGHGIGRALHDGSCDVLNYYDPLDRQRLKEGMVVAIEPFVSMKARRVKQTGDGWTLTTPEGSLVAQFEHTVIITKKQPVILTTV